MKNAELIAILSQLPADADVTISDRASGYLSKITGISTVDAFDQTFVDLRLGNAVTDPADPEADNEISPCQHT